MPTRNANMNEQVTHLAERLLHRGLDGLAERERRVLARIAEHSHISRDINRDHDQQMTLGERLADKVAEFGGSWTFILIFAGFMVIWALINTVVLVVGKPFDPYPFVFLNLILSMLAAIQAPIIMMSQNRQADKDRLAAAHDYEVNLKAELEIMRLHEKLDAVRVEQLAKLIELQQEQNQFLAQLAESVGERPALNP